MRSFVTLFAIHFFTVAVLAQWDPLATGMLSSRSMTSLNGDLYVATYPNGVKKSVAGTGPFTSVNTGLPLNGTNYFVQSVGTDGAYLYAGTESGIYRSTSGTDTWNNINGSLTASTTVYANKFFSFGSSILAVFTGTIAQGGGIWRSSTFGNSWILGHSGMGSNVQVYHITQVGAILYASTSVGIYTSSDNAQSWTVLPSVNYTTYSLAAIGNRLVIACTFGMRYSMDSGNSWMDAMGDPSNPIKGELITFDGILYCLLNQVGCLRSVDNGTTWADWNSGFSVVDAQAQEEFFVRGNILYCTALFDIYTSTASGSAINDGTDPHRASIFPTLVDAGFTVRSGDEKGILRLIDATGRSVREIPVQANTDSWIERGNLRPGVYSAMLMSARGEMIVHLGRIVMH